MNVTLASILPQAIHCLAALAGESAPPDAPRDLTDPGEAPDRHGLVCTLHGCARELGEAPLIRSTPADQSIAAVKRRSFPQSWSAVSASNAPRAPLFRRPRMTVVRYCPKCREAAAAWLTGQSSLNG
jgi:hypothetical protein